MGIYRFGSGTLWAKRTDDTGLEAYKFGVLQEGQITFEQTTKMLYGGKQFPLDVGRGTGKITGKAKMGNFDGALIARIFFNVAPSTGQVNGYEDEAGTVAAASPFTVTVTHSATWVDDLGVIYSTTGLPLTRVASAPAQGQYTVSAGVYTFNSADANAAVLISYLATISGTGEKFVITNQNLGIAPTFAATFVQYGKTQQTTLTLNACVSSKLDTPSKLEDYTIEDFEFQAFADASGNIGTWSASSAT